MGIRGALGSIAMATGLVTMVALVTGSCTMDFDEFGYGLSPSGGSGGTAGTGGTGGSGGSGGTITTGGGGTGGGTGGSAGIGGSAGTGGTGGSGGGVLAWINEIHYEDIGPDANEGVEIAGTAGTDLAGWSLVFYDGLDGSSYATNNLSGTIPDEEAGFGALWFDQPGLENGPDAIALVDDANQVVQFLSYEGSFDASDGPAGGTTSQDIGVAENNSQADTESVQLEGTGSQYSDFTWAGPQASSPGQSNSGQTFQ